MDKIFELSRHFNVEGKIMKQNKEQDFVYKIGFLFLNGSIIK